MNRHFNRYQKTLVVLAAALLLRATIPAGYMPTGGDSGLLYAFCPQGVPAEFMQMLAGGHAAHHHHSHDEHSTDYECSLDHLLLKAASVDSPWQHDVASTALAFEALPVRVLAGTTRTHYHSRGPPA